MIITSKYNLDLKCTPKLRDHMGLPGVRKKYAKLRDVITCLYIVNTDTHSLLKRNKYAKSGVVLSVQVTAESSTAAAASSNVEELGPDVKPAAVSRWVGNGEMRVTERSGAADRVGGGAASRPAKEGGPVGLEVNGRESGRRRVGGNPQCIDGEVTSELRTRRGQLHRCHQRRHQDHQPEGRHSLRNAGENGVTSVLTPLGSCYQT